MAQTLTQLLLTLTSLAAGGGGRSVPVLLDAAVDAQNDLPAAALAASSRCDSDRK